MHPKIVVLLIGANNLGVNSEDQIVGGIENLVAVIRTKQPGVKIILLGLLPTDLFGSDTHAPEKVRRINHKLSELNQVTFVDFGPRLLKPDGSFDDANQFDHLHLAPAGYALWAKTLVPVIELLRR